MIIGTKFPYHYLPNVNYDLTYCQNYQVEEGGKSRQYEDRDGVRHGRKSQRDGGEDQGRNKQEDKEVYGGICIGYDRAGGVSSSIQSC